MPAVTRVHSSDTQVFINDVRIKGVSSFNFSNDKDVSEIRKLGSFKTEEYVLNANQPVTTEMNFLLTSRENLQSTLLSNIDSAIDGRTANASNIDLFDEGVYEESDTTEQDLARNTNCWIHNLKGMTSAVSWNDKSEGDPAGTAAGGVAISKRHILQTQHATYEVGDTVYFMTKDDTLIDREIVAVKNAANSSTSSDFGICLLNEDLPDSIEYARVLPRDSYQYFNPTDFSSQTFYALSEDKIIGFFINRDRGAHLRRVRSLGFVDFDYRNPSSTLGTFGLTAPVSASTYEDWTEAPIAGDSGSPAFLLINNECVLLGVLASVTGENSSGAFVSSAKNFETINQYMRDIDKEYGINTNYQLSTIDLSQEFRPLRSTQYMDFLSHEETTIALKDNAGTTTISKAYLTDYSLEFAVGDFAKGSYSYEADSISANSTSETETISDSFNIFRPQSITVTTDFNEGINSTEYAIQNINLEISITREPTIRIGSRTAKRRYPTLPSNGSLNFSIIKNNATDTVDLSNLVTEKGNFTFSIQGSESTNSTLNIKVDNCFLESVSSSHSLDGNATLDFNYSFSISNDAIKYYFS